MYNDYIEKHKNDPNNELYMRTVLYDNGLLCYDRKDYTNAGDNFRRALNLNKKYGSNKRFDSLCKKFIKDCDRRNKI